MANSAEYSLLLRFFYSLSIFYHSEANENIRQIRIGALFGISDVIQRTTFTFVVDSLNDESTNVKFVPVLLDASSEDSLQMSRKACDLILAESIAVFGPSTEPGLSHVRSICDAKEIPHFMTTFDYSNAYHSYSINILPPPGMIGSAVHDLVKHYGWRRMIILYQDTGGLVMLQDLIQLSSIYDGPFIALKQLQADESLPGVANDFTPLLKHVKEILSENRIIVQADLESSRRLLSQAASMGMVSEHYHYIFTNVDMSTLDLEPYKDSGCNITALRVVDYDSATTKNLVTTLRFALRRATNSKSFLPAVGIQAVVAVLYDSVRLLAEAVHDRLDSLRPTALDCGSDRSWINGTSFINHLKTTSYDGTTGRIQLNGNGERSNFNLTLVELTRDGFQELGVWNTSHYLTVTKNHTLALQQAAQTLEKQLLRVVVYMEEPFVMYKETSEKLTGNDRYEGYCIDLLREIAELLQFNYTIHKVKDNAYGSADPVTKSWNGLVGELMSGQADLAVSALTISYGRSEVIDFTVPYMHLGISILFKKPDRKDPSLFSFLSPLALDVWIYMLAAYLGVSLMLWVLARFSPYEWFNPHPCNPHSDVMENQFSLLNSLWFTVGSLMQQGSDLAPRAASTRLVAGVWWFFTLILISSYTANLAAFLTVERMVPQIESAEDLVKPTKIKYGSLNRGSTMAFFSESKIPTYERMWTIMRSTQPSVFVNSSSEGITRVLNNDYAYLMESAMLEYYVERDCNLTQINGLIDSKGYGIGLPKGSIYRELLSSAILRLQEKAVLAELKNRWWKEKRGGGKCKDDGGKSQHNELGLQNVGGVFVALLCGLAMALLVGIIEFLYKAAQNADQDQGSVCQAMWRDFKFALRCKGSKHTVRRKSGPVATGYFDDGAGALVPAFGVNTASGYTALAARSLEALSPRVNNR